MGIRLPVPRPHEQTVHVECLRFTDLQNNTDFVCALGKIATFAVAEPTTAGNGSPQMKTQFEGWPGFVKHSLHLDWRDKTAARRLMCKLLSGSGAARDCDGQTAQLQGGQRRHQAGER